MKRLRWKTRTVRGPGSLTRLGYAVLLLYAVAATVAQASTVLVADTTLVTGSQSATFSFQAPGPGTVSVQLANLDWPQALSSLSFMAATPSSVLTSGSLISSTQSFAFQVAAGGNYFTDVMAVAGGPLDLGAYSFYLTFTPAAPVPLPASGVLLLGGVACLVGLLRLWRSTRDPRAVPVAALSAP